MPIVAEKEKLNSYSYEILSSSDEPSITDAAECLAETFIGVKVGDSFVREPMAHAVNLSKETFQIFVEEYIKNVVEQGFCYIARDKETGKVVGALAAEIFNPDDEAPIFEDDLEPMNKIISFLGELDGRFIEAFESKMQQKLMHSDLTHGFMIGVRVEKSKKLIAAELVRMWIEDSSKRGYKGVFVEATNFRSQKLVVDMFDFYVPVGSNNQPIVSKYSDDEIFKIIPEDISTECMILYKNLVPSYKI